VVGEPGKYRIVVTATDVLPALSNVVGVTTSEAAKTRGDFIRGVLKARRKAVEFMQSNPAEASAIIAKAYNLEPASPRKSSGCCSTREEERHPVLGTGRHPARHDEQHDPRAEARRRDQGRRRLVEAGRRIVPPDDLKSKKK
jgi:hypothetical protein